jgi:hypothetical protein
MTGYHVTFSRAQDWDIQLDAQSRDAAIEQAEKLLPETVLCPHPTGDQKSPSG